ncbi:MULTISPECIES: hypothetical protein [unclassified Fusibacter]|uniref:SF0329 family protein n=1 Tax=unclassified Fusibacter TaxID=2624464 RepID=UPI001012E313|nr:MULTISPECIES: hypothetical protein [unclassified Fusibacter]MCK8061500.1 hypothetical protein [Fusibacter sp. A2]NPE23685.1 hypothetical protein [Fusibacter sp. A1]RXV58863.1 hypothetical protein DWB64_18030 [Fusibacter sp. A1]
MIWNKLKKQLESFLCPALIGKVEYLPSGYRYLPDKVIQCYLTVDKEEVFNTSKKSLSFQWYGSEQEVKSDTGLKVTVTPEEVSAVKKVLNENVPEDRLAKIAGDRKAAQLAKQIYASQGNLFKSDFQKKAVLFLSESIESSLDSDDILLNVLAIIDRRVGKKRLLSMKETIQMKHPVVRYFYDLRVS